MSCRGRAGRGGVVGMRDSRQRVMRLGISGTLWSPGDGGAGAARIDTSPLPSRAARSAVPVGGTNRDRYPYHYQRRNSYRYRHYRRYDFRYRYRNQVAKEAGLSQHSCTDARICPFVTAPGRVEQGLCARYGRHGYPKRAQLVSLSCWRWRSCLRLGSSALW